MSTKRAETTETKTGNGNQGREGFAQKRIQLEADVQGLQQEAKQHQDAIRQKQGEIQQHQQILVDIQRRLDRVAGARSVIGEMCPEEKSQLLVPSGEGTPQEKA